MNKPQITFDPDDDLLQTRADFLRLRWYLAFGWAGFLLFLFVFPFSMMRIGGPFGLLASLIVITTIFLVIINKTVKNEMRGYALRQESKKRKNEDRAAAAHETLSDYEQKPPVHYVVGDDGELTIANDEQVDDDEQDAAIEQAVHTHHHG